MRVVKVVKVVEVALEAVLEVVERVLVLRKIQLKQLSGSRQLIRETLLLIRMLRLLLKRSRKNPPEVSAIIVVVL